jgi:hypothetical protein
VKLLNPDRTIVEILGRRLVHYKSWSSYDQTLKAARTKVRPVCLYVVPFRMPTHFSFSVMAIHTSSYRISSDLRSQSGVGAVSTGVGDHLGILRAITFAFDSKRIC